MKRETVQLIDLAKNDKYPNDNNLHIDDWDTVKVISREMISFDAEKGFIDEKVIFQRKSDEKYFKFEYTKFGYEGDDILEQEAEEVFKKTKIIEIFE